MSLSRLRAIVLLGSLLALAATSFAAKHKKTSPDLAAATANQPQRVIIQYYTAPSATETALLSALGGQLQNVLGSINAVVTNLSPSQLDALAADPNVKYISADRPVMSHQAVSINGAEYTTEPINAPEVWQQGYTGTNVGIAVIDSGITPVADLGTSPLSLVTNLVSNVMGHESAPGTVGRIVYSRNFVPNEDDALDHYGHGTLIAGLIAGNGAESTGRQFFRTFRGSAPDANIINLRVLDENGEGTDSSVIAAIEKAIKLRHRFNIRVINLSLGRPVYESYTLDPLCQAVEQAWKAGIVVVVAAGNDGRDLNMNPEGYGTIDSPGNDPYAITVGAMNTRETASIHDDIIASYSSKGPSFIDHVIKPDIVAPGNLVTSLEFPQDPLAEGNPSFYTWYSFYQKNGPEDPSQYYFPMSGTSMAAGVVSGAIADLLQAAPRLTPDQVKALVMATADRSYFPLSSSVTAEGTVYNANYDVFTIGSGYLDLSNAVNAALHHVSVPAGTAMSPIAVYDPDSGDTTAVIDPSALWTAAGPWSAAGVYGSHAFVNSGSGSTPLWGSTALWSNNDANGFSQLWSSTILWGKGTPEAATILWGKGGTDGQTILWGKDGTNSQTILWGKSDPWDSETSVQY